MKRRELIIYSSIFLILVVGTINIVFAALTNHQLINWDQLIPRSQNQQAAISEKCSSQPPLPITVNDNAELIQLTKYQQFCQSYVTNQLMIFETMPNSTVNAQAMADTMAKTLITFSQNRITPLVVIEPETAWGLIDFQEFDNGFYDNWIQAYFARLQSDGITDSQMGTWVPFPEPNLPEWNNQDSTPADFASVVNKYLGFMKADFPQAQGSIMLSSSTYPTTDFNWSDGEYLSLLPYVEGLNKNYINSIGYEGFPWLPDAKQTGPGILDANQYLNDKIVVEAAQSLGVTNIWINTGTFRSKYTLDPQLEIQVEPAMRKAILSGIAAQALKIKKQGYNITLNLFSQDKSMDSEATDWSYLNNPQDEQDFAQFVQQLHQDGIRFSLFDE